jgi:lipopolysaccharide biosynthesis protein
MTEGINDLSSPELINSLFTRDLDPLFWRPGRGNVPSEWYTHIPFAHWIVGAVKPRMLVELGTAHGVSYSAFCESVINHSLDTRCYAVDTWQENEHKDVDEDNGYADLKTFNEHHYGSFSELFCCTFDEAKSQLPDNSVDLLHIDGLYTYDAVRHDFENWREKLSNNAVVLFHTTSVRQSNFGVWRLWEELKTQFPCFEFFHGRGLGVLGVGSSLPIPIKMLCELRDTKAIQRIRERFAQLGERWALGWQQYQSIKVQHQEIAVRDTRIQELKHRVTAEGLLRARAAERARLARSESTTNAPRVMGDVSQDLKPVKAASAFPDFFECRTSKPKGRIAVVLHLHYDELWSEMESVLSHISEPFDLFVTRTSKDQEVEEKIKAAFPEAYILHFENRGRDILPFIALVLSGVLFRYTLICKLHTKKSLHRCDGDQWRHMLVDGVLGNEQMVREITTAFDRDPDLGIVVADNQIYGLNPEEWADNWEKIYTLGSRIGLQKIDDTPPFPGGSIYWIRPFILRQIAALQLTPDDFEPEPLPPDGTTAHALERLIGLICRDAGMHITETGQLNQSKNFPNPNPSLVPKVIAFYLPQFHPTPENDAWWGKGFTEWTNVTRGTSIFPNHYQPRLPADLGFYDLRLPEVREEQATLARQYGIAAFCYYYYWFDSRRALELPLNEVLRSGSPDFPFLICWANEPWARNWDGGNREILIPQNYNEDWPDQFARDIAHLLKDKRYFRLDDKPVVLIYRIMHIPKRSDAIHRLRRALQKLKVEDVYILAGKFALEGDENSPTDPREIGIDNYFEFPPHGITFPRVDGNVKSNPEFMGSIHDYDGGIESALANLSDEHQFLRHRGVTMGWDNTARRGFKSSIIHGATPAKFRRWLRAVIKHETDVRSITGRMMFVNAWNEWAEGTYLEPDQKYGHGWLEAVASALGKDLNRDQTISPYENEETK